MTIRELFVRERRCYSCGIAVPVEHRLYRDGQDRGWCLVCVVERVDAADFAVTEDRLRRLFGEPA